MCRRIDITRLSANSLPNSTILAAGDNLKAHAHIMRAFTDYPGDTSDCLDGLVLAKEGFESELPHHPRVSAGFAEKSHALCSVGQRTLGRRLARTSR